MTINIKLQCDACDNGIVIIKKTVSRTRINFKFNDCNVCGKVFGFMRTGNLKPVQNDIKESEVKNGK
jgi:uncharacterized Zn finger protein